MSRQFEAAPHRDGRINLEWQRKLAKRLLRQLQDGQLSHYQTILRTVGISPATVHLSHALWLVARDLGFSSWPALKAHVGAVEFAAAHPAFHADDEASTIHWRCGSDLTHALKRAGFKGQVRTLTDPFTMGPVLDRPLDQYLASRGQYLAEMFSRERLSIDNQLRREYASMAALGGHRSVLWCEADAYDQLFLIRLLAEPAARHGHIELIAVADVPGVSRFVGMGQLAPELLAWLWPQRRLLERDAFDLARQAWAAYCAPTPQAWADLADRPTPALPLLAPALRRQLQELPSARDGLSLTERHALEIVQEFGEITVAHAFSELQQAREALPYLGDLMFHAVLRPLIDTENPLLLEQDNRADWSQRRLTLTRLGDAILDGRDDWLAYATRDRWVGGVHIAAGRAHWTIGDDCKPVWRK
ncbi:hypothetical protein C5O80_31485 [Burkholderia sp. SRS-46]|nr:hypothetical protein C5O80_31485 [Burkholderia sp. SRS-46]